jgi:hypothetical protein
MNRYYCRFLSEAPADHLKVVGSLNAFLGTGLQWQDHQNGMSVQFTSPWAWPHVASRVRAISREHPEFMFRLYQEGAYSAMEWQITNGESYAFGEFFPKRNPESFRHIQQVCRGESLLPEIHGASGPEQQ